MKITLSEFISNIELNDYRVLSVSLDIQKREFKLITNGCYWFKDPSLKGVDIEGEGLIKAINYRSFEARYFSSKDRLWYNLNYENIELMWEINVKSYENSILNLAGNSAKNSYWIEYLIDDAEFEFEFNSF